MRIEENIGEWLAHKLEHSCLRKAVSVIVDGGWSKRLHKYSKSRVAFMIGQATGEWIAYKKDRNNK